MTRRPPAQPPRKPHAGMASLSRDLSELERTDPAVKAGAEAYDRMVAKVTGKTLAERMAQLPVGPNRQLSWRRIDRPPCDVCGMTAEWQHDDMLSYRCATCPRPEDDR